MEGLFMEWAVSTSNFMTCIFAILWIIAILLLVFCFQKIISHIREKDIKSSWTYGIITTVLLIMMLFIPLPLSGIQTVRPVDDKAYIYLKYHEYYTIYDYVIKDTKEPSFSIVYDSYVDRDAVLN